MKPKINRINEYAAAQIDIIRSELDSNICNILHLKYHSEFWKYNSPIVMNIISPIYEALKRKKPANF